MNVSPRQVEFDVYRRREQTERDSSLASPRLEIRLLRRLPPKGAFADEFIGHRFAGRGDWTTGAWTGDVEVEVSMLMLVSSTSYIETLLLTIQTSLMLSMINSLYSQEESL